MIGKGPMSITHKELYPQWGEQPKNMQNRKMGKANELTDLKEEIIMANKHAKWCPSSHREKNGNQNRDSFHYDTDDQ